MEAPVDQPVQMVQMDQTVQMVQTVYQPVQIEAPVDQLLVCFTHDAPIYQITFYIIGAVERKARIELLKTQIATLQAAAQAPHVKLFHD